MKKTLSKTLGTIAISFFLVVFGCSKGDNSSSPTNTPKTQLLTSSDWGLAGLQHKAVSASIWTDEYASMTACEKDNRIVFKTNASYESNEGPTKCSASDPQIRETGTWSLTQSETVLIAQATSGTQIFNATVETLTANSLIISYTRVDAISGVTYQYKLSFRH